MTSPFGKADEIALLRKQRASGMRWQGHILVVDDEPIFRFATGIALRKAGYAVTEAADAKEALSLITECGNTEPFNLMLVDVQMPGMSGIELIREVRKRNITIPIFVISGLVDKGFSDELSGGDCQEFLHKPFEAEELITKVLSVLKTGEEQVCPA